MDFNTVILVLGLAIVLCVAYGIWSATSTSRHERNIKHQEFEDSREIYHREKMASIAANRDAEIAKYTTKPPPKQIEG